MMNSDQTRVQSSVFISAAFHALMFGLYLFLRAAQDKNELVLTHVEFVDLKPEQNVQASAPMQAPRGVMDFIKMALPKLSQAEPQETRPQEIPLEKSERFREMPLSRQLVDKGQPLARSAAIDLKSSDLPAARQSSFADISARPDASVAQAEMAMADAGPAIDLEAVGKTAVRASGPAIKIDGGQRVSGSSGFKELSVRSSVAPASSGRVASGTGYDLKEAAPASRRTALPSSSPPIGYGGKGGGIVLKEAAAVRVAAPAIPKAQPSVSAVDEALKSAAGSSKKAVEISGPLARRKIISAVMPQYPEWAKAQGVQAETVIRFFVSREGEVRERVYIERTSGYKELDDLSIAALKKWIFAPLSGEEADQWGIVTFRFRLK